MVFTHKPCHAQESLTMSRTWQPCRPQEAFDCTDSWQQSQGIEKVPVAAAAGRILAENLTAGCDIPEGPRCASDGYALRAADTLGANDYSPLPLRLETIATVIARGQSTSVDVGDALPAGADAVLPLDNGEQSAGILEISGSLAPGDGVIRQGEECRAGEILLTVGRRLRAQDIARLVLAGLLEIPVRLRPRVRILLAGHFDHDADGPMLTALVNRDGGETTDFRVTRDEDELIEALQQPLGDLVLVAGGRGYASRDFALHALSSCGSVYLDGTLVHPGGGVVLGQVETKPIVLLPGTPLACLCAYDLFAARVLRRWGGRTGEMPYRQRRVRLTRKVVSSIGRLELARMQVNGDLAEPIATAEGGILCSATQADGFLLVPEYSEGFPRDSEVDVYLYDEYD
jgi:molybdopterin molybdotransferase